MVDSHSPVLIALFASFCIRTSRAILASIYFLLPAIVVPPYMAAVLKMKGLSVRTSHDSVCPDREVNGPKRILMVFPVSCFLLEHGELHVFFHTVLFTKDVVVVRTVSGICGRVLRIKAVDIPELIHKRNKAVHIWPVLVHIDHSDIFVSNTNLNIIRGKQLIIPHVVGFDPHESGRMVCFWVAVTSFSTDTDLFNVFLQLLCILH